MDPSNVLVRVESRTGQYHLLTIKDDHLSQLIAVERRPYEAHMLDLGLSLVPSGRHILDVGANIGNHSVYWARSGRHVRAFEPNHDVHLVLRQNVEMNGLTERITLHELALGEEEGFGRLAALLPGNLGAMAVESDPAGSVRVTPLDGLEVESCDLIKIDVEGHELDVLRGAVRTIGRCRPYIIAESREGDGGVSTLLRDMGYRKVPVSLATTDTYLYTPSLAATVRAASRPAMWRAASAWIISVTRRRSSGLLSEPMRRFLRRQLHGKAT